MSDNDVTVPENLDAEEIRTSRDGQVATLTIRRPKKHNALNLKMWVQLHDAVESVANDDSVRAVVIRGEGVKAFSAGADISEFIEVRQDAARARHYSDTIERAELAIIRSRKPVIALMRGVCAGGGCGIALACTLRYADDSFRFSIPASRLGVVYHQTAVDRLVQQVGPSTAMDILMSGRFVDSDEARARGLLDAIYPAEELEERVYDYAKKVAKRSRVSVEGAWVGVHAALNAHDEQLRREVLRLQSAAHDGEDYREGVQAFMQKRQPIFGITDESTDPIRGARRDP